MKKIRKIEFIPGYDFVVCPTEKYGSNYGRNGMTVGLRKLDIL